MTRNASTEQGAVMSTEEDWKRVADYVVSRRTDLGYRRQDDFADAVGITTRVISNVETAKRNRYARSTIVLLEQALQWEPGSIEAILGGREPTPLNPHSRATRQKRRIDAVRDLLRDAQRQLDDIERSIEETDDMHESEQTRHTA